jgi:hypothetical protein
VAEANDADEGGQVTWRPRVLVEGTKTIIQPYL